MRFSAGRSAYLVRTHAFHHLSTPDLLRITLCSNGVTHCANIPGIWAPLEVRAHTTIGPEKSTYRSIPYDSRQSWRDPKSR